MIFYINIVPPSDPFNKTFLVDVLGTTTTVAGCDKRIDVIDCLAETVSTRRISLHE